MHPGHLFIRPFKERRPRAGGSWRLCCSSAHPMSSASSSWAPLSSRLLGIHPISLLFWPRAFMVGLGSAEGAGSRVLGPLGWVLGPLGWVLCWAQPRELGQSRRFMSPPCFLCHCAVVPGSRSPPAMMAVCLPADEPRVSSSLPPGLSAAAGSRQPTAWLRPRRQRRQRAGLAGARY